MVSLRLVPRTWKLPRAADRSLLSWQGMHKSVIYSGAQRLLLSVIEVLDSVVEAGKNADRRSAATSTDSDTACQ